MTTTSTAATAPLTAPVLLEVDCVSARFGGVQALRDVSLTVAARTICALIGPNGAGKTTLFNCISRVYEVAGGTIRYRNIDITHAPRHSIVGLGIARTFQNVGLVPSLSVLDNVMLGATAVIRPSFWRPLIPGSAQARREVEAREGAHAMLGELGLAHEADRRTSELAFGTLKRVELARALLSRPSLLMLDEPANGLAHGEVDALAELILDVRRRFDVAVLLVEHHMRMVLRISDQVAVLQQGERIALGTPEAVRNDPCVIAAYLGTTA
ncbi:MAG: ABC transporter ATP-binding protein [Burkholderiaceae bacterium]